MVVVMVVVMVKVLLKVVVMVKVLLKVVVVVVVVVAAWDGVGGDDGAGDGGDGWQTTAPATKSVYKVLRLPRNLHFQVYKILRLRLLRNFHFQVHMQSTAPATKSALQGSQSAWARHEICTSRFTSRSPAKAVRSKSTSTDNVTQVSPETSFDF